MLAAKLQCWVIWLPSTPPRVLHTMQASGELIVQAWLELKWSQKSVVYLESCACTSSRHCLPALTLQVIFVHVLITHSAEGQDILVKQPARNDGRHPREENGKGQSLGL